MILKVITNVLGQMNKQGFAVDGIVGDRYILSRNSGQDGIMFHFEMPKYEELQGNDDLRWTVIYWIDAPKKYPEYDFDIDSVIFANNQKFKNLLEHYRNEQDQQLFYNFTSNNAGFLDMGKEIKTTGYLVTLTFFQQLTDDC
jgi:hypothetical protein